MSDYYGFPSERAFHAAYENEAYCNQCESHPCRCGRYDYEDEDANYGATTVKDRAEHWNDNPWRDQ